VIGVKPRQRCLSILVLVVLVVSANAFPGEPEACDGQRKRPPKFEAVKVGEIIDKKATSLGFESSGRGITELAFTIFKASNGEGGTVQHTTFRSSDEAKRFLDWKVGGSSKSLKQEKKLDKNRTAVGLRAELLIGPDAYGNTLSAVIWTEGEEFYFIQSESMSNARELEKMYAH